MEAGDPADLLARGDLFRHRRIARARPARRTSSRAPYQAFRAKRRLDQHRRRQPVELGAHRRSARPSRVARRPALRDELRSHGEPRRPGRADERRARHAQQRPSGSTPFDAAGVPVGAGQQHRRGTVASADARARHGGRSRPPAGRRDEGPRLPGAFFRDADRRSRSRAAARRAHAQPAARIRLQRCRDRRIHRERVAEAAE